MSCADILRNQTCSEYPQPDPDISGIGVLVSFLASAWISLAFVATAYWLNFLPKELLRDYDILFCRRRPHDSEGWSKALQKAVLVFSDQQIITGIAVLVAGFAGWHHISVYHWQIVIYLAWMSSNVHLTSLTFLREYLQTNKVLKVWRIAGMTVLFGLLVAALVPTSTSAWSSASYNSHARIKTNGGNSTCYSMQLPARCFWDIPLVTANLDVWKSDGLGAVSTDAILSYVLIVVSYLWKAVMLFEPGKAVLNRWIRDTPLRLFERLLKRVAVKRTTSGRSILTSRSYQFIMSAYVCVLAMSDLAESFAGSLWVITIGLAWGTIQLWLPRSILPSNVRQQEDTWGFGQLLPMLLLVLPLLAVLEHFYGEKEDCEHSDTHHEESNVEMDELLADDNVIHGTKPSRAHRPMFRKHPRNHLTALQSSSASQEPISRLVLQLHFEDKTTTQALRQAFYLSRIFKASLWLLNIIVAASVSLWMSAWAVAGTSEPDSDYWTIVITLIGFECLPIWVVVAASIPWSRLYR